MFQKNDKLSTTDKVINYCSSCSNRLDREEIIICNLTNSNPDFDASCSDYNLDNSIDVKEAKLSLSYDFHVNNGGYLYPNQYFHLLHGNKEVSSSIFLNAKSRKTFRSYALFKAENILIFVFILSLVGYNWVYKGINDFLNVWFYVLILILGIFIFSRVLLRHNRLVIDINGIRYNESIYLWNAIEDVFLKQIDNGSETDGEEYLVLVLISGKIINLDTQHINFLGVKRFKKIINDYRQESLKNT